MDKRKVVWHDAFFEALKLELHEYMEQAFSEVEGMERKFLKLLAKSGKQHIFIDFIEEEGWLAEKFEAFAAKAAKEAAKNAAVETTRRLLGFGVSTEHIAAATGLAIDEVRKLSDNLSTVR